MCDGDGTSCLGCDGIPNSGKVTDVCAVCDGDGTSCCNGGGCCAEVGNCNETCPEPIE